MCPRIIVPLIKFPQATWHRVNLGLEIFHQKNTGLSPGPLVKYNYYAKCVLLCSLRAEEQEGPRAPVVPLCMLVCLHIVWCHDSNYVIPSWSTVVRSCCTVLTLRPAQRNNSLCCWFKQHISTPHWARPRLPALLKRLLWSTLLSSRPLRDLISFD